MVMAGLYDGAVASEERWQTRRSEARRAFNEFMQMNPQATYEDYRSFVNDISDGNSFIRGGIPADKILERLAQTKAEQYAQEQMQKRLNIMSSQAQLAGQIDVLANNFAIDIDDDEKLTDTVAGALGYDPARPETNSIRDLVKRQYPTGYGTVRDLARQEIFDKHLPTFEKVIKANPNLTDEELVRLIPGLGQMGQSRLFGELAKSARTKVQEEMAAQSKERVKGAVEDVRKQIEATGQYSLPQLEGNEASEVERQIKPYMDGYTQKKEQEKRQRAREAMATEATLYLSTAGYSQSLVNNPQRQLQFKEGLRRAAITQGIQPNEEDVQAQLDRALEAGRSVSNDKDEQSLKDYERDLEKAVSMDGITISTLPMYPHFTDAKYTERARTAYGRSLGILTDLNTKREQEASYGAISSVAEKLSADQAWIDQLSRNDISPERVKDQVAQRLRIELRKEPTPAQVNEVVALIGGKLDTINSSQVAKAASDHKEVTRATAEANSKVGLAGVQTIVLQNLGADGEETPQSAVVRTMVEGMIFGPASGNYVTDEAIIALQPFLTKDFYEKHKGNVAAMYAEIMNGDAGKLIRAGNQKAKANLSTAGFPYEDRRGSKQPIIKDMPEKASLAIRQIGTEAKDAVARLAEFAKRDDPTTTADGRQPVAEFNAALNDAVNRAKQEAKASIDQIRTWAARSDQWSTDGAISDDELKAIEQRIAIDLKNTLSQIDKAMSEGQALVQGFGVKPEDKVMGDSPRIQDQKGQPSILIKGGFLDRLINEWPDPVY